MIREEERRIDRKDEGKQCKRDKKENKQVNKEGKLKKKGQVQDNRKGKQEGLGLSGEGDSDGIVQKKNRVRRLI